VSESDVLTAFQERLSEKGLKSTRQRQLIVSTFFELDRHISVDDLLVEVRKVRESTGYATVYRTLKLLVELGFANERRFGGVDAPTLYDPLWGREEHFHLICSDCNRIVEFEDGSASRSDDSASSCTRVVCATSVPTARRERLETDPETPTTSNCRTWPGGAALCYVRAQPLHGRRAVAVRGDLRR